MVNDIMPNSGLFVGADGRVYDATNGMSDTGLTADISRYSYNSGLFIGSDGQVYDITALIGSGSNPGGSGASSVTIDTTLTQSGKAADAAAVGTVLETLCSEISGSRHSFSSADDSIEGNLGETWACVSAPYAGTLQVSSIGNPAGHCMDVLRIILLAGNNAGIAFEDTVLWANAQVPEFSEGKLYEIILSDLYEGVFSASFSEYTLPEDDD